MRTICTEPTVRYKGMFPKRAGKPEMGDAAKAAEDGAEPWLKSEASLHAYSVQVALTP